MIGSDGNSTAAEIRDVDWKLDPGAKLATLLRARLVPADPSFPDPGSPAIRFEQPETGVPIFLVKFIGIAPAGGWGDVDSDNALVLDLRNRTLSMPAALGCIKDDFAGQGPGGGWARCHWDPMHHDYDCATSGGEFFLVSGKKVTSKTDPPGVERIRFPKGQTSTAVTDSIAAEEGKRYVLRVGKAKQRLAVHIDSANSALKFAVLELSADQSGQMKIDDCVSTPKTETQCTQWEGVLPDAAEYVIELYSRSQPAKYTLGVSIR